MIISRPGKPNLRAANANAARPDCQAKRRWLHYTTRASALRGYASGKIAWVVAAVVVAIAACIPVLSLGVTALEGSGDLWPHILSHVFPPMLVDTGLLLLGVGILVAGLGCGLAWLVTAFEFPGRRVLEWLLVLPLAVPTYIVAYVYVDVLHPVAALQTTLRDIFGLGGPQAFRLPDVRSLGGCILLFSFILYPYVYLAVRAMFTMQSGTLMDVSRTLGARPSAVFFRVALPLARPAIAAGTTLALLEALNDIGAAEMLGVQTISVSIYSTWINRSTLPGAAQIAVVMLAVVAGLIAVERWSRRRRKFVNSVQRTRPAKRQKLSGLSGWIAALCASTPVLIGFMVPVGYLANEAQSRIRFAGIPSGIPQELMNTVSIASVATIIVVVLGTIVAYAARISSTRLTHTVLRGATLGYALPGTVLAIGLLTPLGLLDNAMASIYEAVAHRPAGLLLAGSGLGLIYAYTARFLTVSTGGIEAGFQKIPVSFDHAARVLGQGVSGTFRRVHLTLLRPSLAAAALLVFVDCMKELPATLLLRPLNFETLATHVYGEASRGTYEDGAIAALFIVLIGLLPVAILARLGAQTMRKADSSFQPLDEAHNSVTVVEIAPVMQEAEPLTYRKLAA